MPATVIRVEDALPEKYQSILGYFPDKSQRVCLAQRLERDDIGTCWVINGGSDFMKNYQPTHWMLMPSPPT